MCLAKMIGWLLTAGHFCFMLLSLERVGLRKSRTRESNHVDEKGGYMIFAKREFRTAAQAALLLGVLGLAMGCAKKSDSNSAATDSSSASSATTSPAAFEQSSTAVGHFEKVAMSSDQMAKAKSLAEAKGCFACHQVDAKVVGPAFAWVAYKYHGNPKAEAKLANAIQHGVNGVWGGMPMPAQNVTPAEAKELADWVLAQKPIAPPKAS